MEIKNISDVCIIYGGYAFPSTSYVQNEIPLIRISNIKSDNKVIIDKSISVKFNEKLSNYIIKNQDILIALSGATTGKFGIYDNDGISYLNQRVGLLRANDNLNQRYLFYYLNLIQDEILRNAGGAAQPNISTNQLGKFQIPLPPLSTQKKIAEKLDKADALRKKDQELLAQYDELAQAIFIDMFGDPVQNEKGWKVKKLKDLTSKILSGNTPKGGSEVYVDKGVTFFRSQNDWKNFLDYEDIAFIDEATHKKMNNSSLKHKDILMTKTGRINTENSSLGRASLFLGEDDSANINGHVYLIRLLPAHIHEFILYILISKSYRNHIRSVCVGGIDKRQLNKDHIEDFPIIYPPIELQQKFASLFINIKAQKALAKKQAQESEDLFQALLQESFNFNS